MIGLTRANSLAVVASAANRAAGRIHEQHGRGLTSLATISATAPFVGATGNIYWLLSFPSSGEKTRLSLTILRIVSHSLWFTEAGLLIAIVSYAGYRYFRERRKDMRGEMRAAVVELVATLRVCFRVASRLNERSRIARAGSRPRSVQWSEVCGICRTACGGRSRN